MNLRAARRLVGKKTDVELLWDGLTTRRGQALASHVCEQLGLPAVRVVYSRRFCIRRGGFLAAFSDVQQVFLTLLFTK